MKRRELLMLVASSGSVFAPSLSVGSEQTLDAVVDSDATDPPTADSDMAGSDNAHETAGNNPETVELTIELY